jgi:hypothetical protein
MLDTLRSLRPFISRRWPMSGFPRITFSLAESISVK